jgi:UDP-N-acetyl-2-amino-2-deoxyglucuronate dehydrogenase
MINSNVYWTRPQSYFDKEGDWHGTKKIDGGAFYTQASHYIDLMQLIAAKPIKSVLANLKRLKRHIETEDTGIAQFEWENGIIGSANLTVLTYPKNLEGSITIIGENGTVKIGGVALNHIECWQFADQKCQQLWQPTNSNYSTESVYGFGHKSYYQNVVETLKGNAKAEVSGEEGLKSLQILDAIYQSNENKKTIYFHQGDSE